MPTILVQQPGDEAIEAVAAYAQRVGWQLRAFSDNSLAQDHGLLAAADGVIACTRSPATIASLRASGRPWLNLRHAFRDGPAVVCDQRAIGRLAGTHLAALGVAGIAVLGRAEGDLWSGVQAACGRQLPLHAVAAGRLAVWLQRLDRPWGLLCPSDGQAVAVIGAAHDAGRRVPDDLAVCGINNNRAQVLCAAVPLSSVDLGLANMAATAARLLHARLTRRQPIPLLTLVPPNGVVARRSTDVQHALEPVLAAALRAMEAGFADGIRLDAVLRRCGCSRSHLERLFQARFATTPGAWLRERRLREARHLVEAGGLGGAAIAARCGLSGAGYLARAFRRRFGRPPSRWRAT